ncbi:MAG: class III poly(R)-hydroxyalkanoic acid synthase subunit PhaE [Xanthomonadales bacterium]|nr:class III poly(R)-hydroxyalkanoic acid synthase subunit PhaE [Xanthomonadales bacterium]
MAGGSGDMPDLMAMGEQYWKAWTDFAQNAMQGQSMDWRDPVQAFSRAAGPLGGEAGHAVDALVEQGQRYLGFLQSAAGRMGVGESMSPPNLAEMWKQNIGADNALVDAIRAVSSEGARGFEQIADEIRPALEQARGEWLKTLSTPAFGYSREQQERMQALIRAHSEFETAQAAYHALLMKASQRGMEYFEERLADRAEPGRQLESARAVYDLWVDAAEQAYAEVALSPEFRKVYGDMVNAQMRVKARAQDEVNRQAAQFGLPTRSELDGTHEKIRDLRRELRALRKHLEELESAPASESADAAGARTARGSRPEVRKSAAGARRASRAAAGKPAAARPAKARKSSARAAPAKRARVALVDATDVAPKRVKTRAAAKRGASGSSNKAGKAKPASARGKTKKSRGA